MSVTEMWRELVSNPFLEKFEDSEKIEYILPHCGKKFSGSKKLSALLEYFENPRTISEAEEIVDNPSVIADLFLNSLLVPPNNLALNRGILSTTNTNSKWLSSVHLSGKNCIFGVPFSSDPFGYLSASIGPREIFKIATFTECKKEAYVGDVLSLSDEGRKSVAERVFQLVAFLCKIESRPIAVGGDHSITYDLVRALKEFHPDIGVISFDAHADDGEILATANARSPISNANVMRYLEETLMPNSVFKLGVRTGDFGPENCLAGVVVEQLRLAIAQLGKRPVYLSIDIDVLDPEFAPNVNYPVKGGLSPQDLLAVMDLVFRSSSVVGMDVVEVCGSSDPENRTANIASSILAEGLRKI